ncbi:MAG: hypothetical protein WAM76_11615, partial [Pseudolabrys sp.]
MRRPRNTDTRGSGIALLKLAHPPQHTAQHRNSTHLRAAWYLSYVANEHVGIIDFAYQIANKPLNVRFGSKADVRAAKSHVRFNPKSGHVRCKEECP